MSFDYFSLPHSGIRGLAPYVPGRSIESLVKEKALKHVIKLASNENPLGSSPLVLQALKAMPMTNISSYPDVSQHPLREHLAAHLGVLPKQIALANGSDTLFPLLLTLFALHTNKLMLTHELSFQTYRIQAHVLGIPTVVSALDEHFRLNIDNLIQACTEQTGIVLFANPNNPTGIITPLPSIRRFLDHIPESTIVVIDEAYYEYAYLYQEDSALSLLPHYPNLIITRTFSKAYGLAGLRLGYAIASEAIIRMLLNIQPPFAVNRVALDAADAALSDQEFVKHSILTNQQGMKQLQEGLSVLGITPFPSSCNFLTFECKNAERLYEALLNQGIIIRPLAPYGFINGLRVSIGTKEQNQQFLEALSHFWSLCHDI